MSSTNSSYDLYLSQSCVKFLLYSYATLIYFPESALERILEAHYEDGTYAPSGYDRPNARAVSEATMAGLTGEGSYQNRTALLVFFGKRYRTILFLFKKDWNKQNIKL